MRSIGIADNFGFAGRSELTKRELGRPVPLPRASVEAAVELVPAGRHRILDPEAVEVLADEARVVAVRMQPGSEALRFERRLEPLVAGGTARENAGVMGMAAVRNVARDGQQLGVVTTNSEKSTPKASAVDGMSSIVPVRWSSVRTKMMFGCASAEALSASVAIATATRTQTLARDLREVSGTSSVAEVVRLARLRRSGAPHSRPHTRRAAPRFPCR
jgi:hypothetical protein